MRKVIFTITEKLYSPVYCKLMGKYHDDFGDDHEGSPISQHAAAYYLDEVHRAILKERMPDEAERGLMNYCNDDDSVNKKVHSLFVDVEVHDGRLWGVATLELTEPLTPEELDILREELSGQYSDGFGEGFEQREIRVDDGDLYVHLWSGEEEFYIITEREFRQRLGLEPLEPAQTPAQAALSEPDAFDDPNVAALRLQLIERLDSNLSEYFDTLRGFDGREVADSSLEIGAWMNAHNYLTELFNFHTSELEYLLKFQNPLEVVANEFQYEATIENSSHIMWRIFDKQDALQGDYPLISETPAKQKTREAVSEADTERLGAMKSELSSRLDLKLSDYCESVMENGKQDIVGMAEEIATRFAVRYYLQHRHDFDIPQLEFLLRYDDPLDVVSDHCPTQSTLIDMSGALHDICALEGALQKDYPLVGHTVKDKLFDKLAKNLTETVNDLQGYMTQNARNIQVAIDTAGEIAMVGAAYDFISDHPFSDNDARLLLQYDDPLSLFTERWEEVMVGAKYAEDVTHAVLADIEKSAERAMAAVSEVAPLRGNRAEQPSVLSQIRDATKASKEPRGDRHARGNSDPEH